ncbi:flagellar hook-associated protein FlgL [Paenibacillus sp. PsM32]|uniref:flagellar hook-associated protein FlgL n=1 Tax=Paenibacillus sp. PsM32 TaxID=3030536 RepID=UPI00263BC979|nr:flagellar hook-associated protein FlgL [Paenibacillus sp. PsM32]MDN4620371.1 flagellar hook-associated protein FlgL [Paenibacillus sp. PsM32]
MRITSSMITSQTLRNLNKSQVTMDNLNDQSTTGKKINKASDDPTGTTYALRYRAELSANDQYQSNTDAAQSWLDYSDTIMGQAGDIMTRMKELTVQAGTGTTESSGLTAIKDELLELKKQLADIGNSQLTGKYIFNGEQVDQKPYELSDSVTSLANVKTDTGQVTYGISEQVSLGVSTNGNDFFGNSTDTDNVFATIDRLTTALTNGDYKGISSEIDNISSRATKMSAARSEVGAKTNRVELVKSRLEDRELNVNTLQASVEDADISEVLIKASSAKSAYQAALQTSASIMQMSLVNFLN